MKDVERLIEELLPEIEKAGEIIMQVYDSGDFEVKLKSDLSPLTEADQKSNQYICEQLKRISPDIPIISEENKEIPYSVRKEFPYCWMVDPLDGTKEFIKRNGEFTINVALIKGNQSIAGIVHLPALRRIYYGVQGKGAFLSKEGKKEKIQAASYDLADSGLIIICSRSHLNEATKVYINQYEDPQLMPQGSALKFTALAEGKAHIYPRIGPTMEWDTAAAQIILEEAGGRVLEWEKRAPLEYNKENLLNPNFIAFADGFVF